MSGERKTGAGSRLSGVLERAPLEPEVVAEPDEVVEESEPPTPSRGRAGGSSKRSRAVDSRAAKRIKGRTVYIPDDLFERILVASHRRDRTISEYICSVLERQVPDHRTRIVEASDDAA
jgi:hypothetical protein